MFGERFPSISWGSTLGITGSTGSVLSLVSIWSLTIVGSLKILPAIVSDYMENTFQRTGDHQRLYGNTFQRSGDRRRSWAILRFSDSSDLAIVSDRMETRLYSVDNFAVEFLSSLPLPRPLSMKMKETLNSSENLRVFVDLRSTTSHPSPQIPIHLYLSPQKTDLRKNNLIEQDQFA